MALLYLVSALLLGTTLVRRLPLALYRFESVAMAVVLGLLGWTWLAFLGSMVLRYDVALPLATFVSTLITLILWPGGRRPDWRPLEGGRNAWIAWGVATAVTTPVLLRLFWTHSLVRDKEGIWTAGASWGDYGAHGSFISHFAAASSLPSDLSIAAGEKITYPFLIDFLSSMYTTAGMSLHDSLFFPGVLLALSIVQLLITTGLRLFHRISVGIGGMVLALTMGSAAGAWAAWDDWRESGQGLFTFLGKLPLDYSQVLDSNAQVTNMVADALLPQRAILFGISVGLIVLTLLIDWRERQGRWQLWTAAVLIGLMPMTHAHTFLLGGALLATLTLHTAWKRRSIPKDFLGPIGLALLLAAPQILWQQTANGRGTGGRFRLGWTIQQGESVLGFYWANFGLLGLALLIVPLALRRNQNRQLLWLLPAAALFGVAQVYAFQPFEYDNLKLISWALLLGGFYVAYLASELVRRHRAWLAAVIPAGLLIITPGVLSIVREFQLRFQFATPDDIAMADWVAKNTPIDAVFATTDRPNISIATLAGRKLIMGYRGWLVSYNIPYTDREAAVKAALAGRFQDPLLQRFGATYLAVNASEDASWPVDRNALAQQAVAWRNASWTIYTIPKLPPGYLAPATPSAGAAPAGTTPAGTTPAGTTP